MWKEQDLPIDKISVDSNLQLRCGLSEERIAEFVDIIEKLPRIKVLREGSYYYLADGFHRYIASQRSKMEIIPCLVREGEYKDAVLIAVQENSKSSLPLSREDKKRAIEKILTFFPERANSWIAEEVGSSMQTVDKTRKQLEDDGVIKKLDELQRRDGRITPREYQMPGAPSRSDEGNKQQNDVMELTRSLGIPKSQTRVNDSVEREDSRSGVSMDQLTSLGLAPRKITDNIPGRDDYKKEKEESQESILVSFDLIISDDVDLKTDIYKLVFLRKGEELDIRLYSGFGENMTPTSVGVKGSFSDFAGKLRKALS